MLEFLLAKKTSEYTLDGISQGFKILNYNKGGA